MNSVYNFVTVSLVVTEENPSIIRYVVAPQSWGYYEGYVLQGKQDGQSAVI